MADRRPKGKAEEFVGNLDFVEAVDADRNKTTYSRVHGPSTLSRAVIVPSSALEYRCRPGHSSA